MRFDASGQPAETTARGGLPVRAIVRLAGVSLIALTAANCAQPQKVAGGRTVDPKYGVAASPRVVADGEAVPKGGGRDMVGKPYQVAGRTYVPRENPNYTNEGLASWYGANFHGRMTANGEVFDRDAIAAAHTTMPLPSYARVTNLQNQRSMIVRVNDRGPYHGNRIIDVSQRVAEALDFKNAGTARVRVEYVGRASTHGSDDTDASSDGLGDDVEADPATDAQDRRLPELDTAELASAEHLVHGVVPADVLTRHEQSTVEVEHTGGVDGAGTGEERLAVAQRLGRCMDNVLADERTDLKGGCLGREHFIEARGATHPAGRRHRGGTV